MMRGMEDTHNYPRKGSSGYLGWVSNRENYRFLRTGIAKKELCHILDQKCPISAKYQFLMGVER